MSPVPRVRLGLAAPLACAAALGGACDARLYPLHAGAATDGGAGGRGDAATDAPPTLNCRTDLVGFGAASPGTSGGAAGPTVTVRTASELSSQAGRTGPVVIRVVGMIAVTGQIDVEDDKTIVGVGRDGGLTGGGLDLSDAQNVILRNLTITKALGVDAVTIQRSRNVWVDHCDLSSDRTHDVDYYDGLVDVTHASDAVTISWTRFHDHFKTTLVGHSASADAQAEDTGHLTVTYHHNLFEDTTTGVRVRFGRVHGFNNAFRRVTEYAFASQMGAEVFAEQNVFQDVAYQSPDDHPVTTVLVDPVEGLAREQGSLRLGMTGTSLITQTATWVPPYAYTPDAADSVPTLVDACAGVGVIADAPGP